MRLYEKIGVFYYFYGVAVDSYQTNDFNCIFIYDSINCIAVHSEEANAFNIFLFKIQRVGSEVNKK